MYWQQLQHPKKQQTSSTQHFNKTITSESMKDINYNLQDKMIERKF
jgi:hypothetical protein